MIDPIRTTSYLASSPPSNNLQNSFNLLRDSFGSLSSLEDLSTPLLSRQINEINFFDCIAEKLLTLWRLILNYFSPDTQSSSSSQIDSVNASCVQNMVDFGNNLVMRVLQEGNVREYANPSCKIAIVAQLNQQIVSQYLTVVTLETLPAVRQLAMQQLRLNLEHYRQNHGINSSDKFKVGTYLLRPIQPNLYDIKYEFSERGDSSGCDIGPRLSRTDSLVYLHLKYGAPSTFRDDFIRFMI